MGTRKTVFMLVDSWPTVSFRSCSSLLPVNIFVSLDLRKLNKSLYYILSSVRGCHKVKCCLPTRSFRSYRSKTVRTVHRFESRPKKKWNILIWLTTAVCKCFKLLQLVQSVFNLWKYMNLFCFILYFGICITFM